MNLQLFLDGENDLAAIFGGSLQWRTSVMRDQHSVIGQSIACHDGTWHDVVHCQEMARLAEERDRETRGGGEMKREVNEGA